jgi:hypothetical protein
LPFYDRLLDKKHDADTTGDNYTFTPSEYSKIINAVSSFNKHLYYTPNGNSYAYKVDKDATRYKELFPSLFEVAGYMDAVDGMCVEEDSFDQRTLGFTPLIMNDTNMTDERAGSTRQRFSVYVGEEMEMTLIGHGGDGGGFFSVSGDMFFRTKVTDARLKYSDSSNYTDAEWSVALDIEGYIFETYTLRLYDNFKPNDDGVSPIEKHDWGLTLGIMRGSGNDMEIVYQPDPDDNEENDTWELKPGSSSTAHPDTCDDYGKEWDYKGTRRISTAEQAQSELLLQFPDSQAAFVLNSDYITNYDVYSVPNETGAWTSILVATQYGTQTPRIYDGMEMLQYTAAMAGHTVTEMMAIDATGVNVGTTENPYIVQNLIVEIGSTSQERGKTLLSLCEKAYSGEETADVLIDNGVGSRFGRFSLKIRAEKPNPHFNPSQPESGSNRRYLKIDNENLRGRGLMDQFYKEYSYWVRNARIAKMTVRMELAQLLSIDKTKRVRVGDITGFIRKMEYQVSNQSGLGLVTMEIMYI